MQDNTVHKEYVNLYKVILVSASSVATMLFHACGFHCTHGKKKKKNMSKYKQLSDQDVVVFSGGESDGEVEIQVARKTRDNAQEEIRKKERLVSESEQAELGKSVEGERRHSDVHEDGTFVDYEAVLNEVGFGLFHVLVLLANGIAFSSDGVEVLSVSFVIPVLKLPTEFSLTGWQNGLLSSSVFLGMLIGGYSWGGVADVIGRRCSLLMSLTLNGISGLASGFAPNVYVLLLFRFVSGIGYVRCVS